MKNIILACIIFITGMSSLFSQSDLSASVLEGIVLSESVDYREHQLLIFYKK